MKKLQIYFPDKSCRAQAGFKLKKTTISYMRTIDTFTFYIHYFTFYISKTCQTVPSSTHLFIHSKHSH